MSARPGTSIRSTHRHGGGLTDASPGIMSHCIVHLVRERAQTMLQYVYSMSMIHQHIYTTVVLNMQL